MSYPIVRSEPAGAAGRRRTGRRSGTLLAALAAAVLLAVAPVHAQEEGRVLGVVQEAASLRPVAGATVEVVGTDLAALTDQSGRFLLLNVSGTEVTLRVSSLGYRTTEVTARVGDTDVQIRLGESPIALDEIVITGTAGGEQRRAVGNLVTRVDAVEAVELAPIANLERLINGRAPGVVITPGTGMVGSGSQIRIRGTNSFSLTNQPLLYVDGVRVDNAQSTGISVQGFGSSVISRINDFNPEDIESIEIIKGPAAATLYGTEASNGVIQIITKQGSQGAPTWNLTVRQGANWFRDAADRVPTNFWRNPETGQVESINLLESEEARGTPLFRTGHVQNYSLSVSGGSDEVRYYLAGDFDREEGAQRDNDTRRGSFRSNLTIVPSNTVELTTSLGYTGGRTNLSCEAGCGGVTWAAYFSTPEHAQEGDQRRGARSFGPEYYMDALEFFQDLSHFTGSLTARHQPVSWFDQRLTVGIDDVREDNESITAKSALYLEWNPTGRGGKFASRRDVSTQTLDYAGTVRTDLTPSVTSTTSVGAQYYRRMLESVSASGSDFAVPGLTVVSATAERDGFENFVESVTIGVFAQQRFGWNDRLFVTGALRADDHSAFGEGFDLVYYPKASATWVISEEPFWGFDLVDELRLRGAYGQAGQQPGAFDARRTFNPVAGPNDESTVTPGTVGNPDLGPERGSELELGFDAGLLDDRLGLELTWYNQNTSDAILLQPVAPSTGFPGSRFINVGEIQNRGIELAVDATPYVGNNVRWDARFSLARNENEVLSISPGVDRLVVSSSFGVEHRVGYPLGSWFHHRVVDAEFDEDGRRIRSSMMCDDGSGGTTPCFDGDDIVAPRVFLGRSDPKNEGSFSSTITLGERIRLYGLVDFKTGFHKWDHVTRVRCALFDTCEANEDPLKFVDSSPASVASYQEGASFGGEYIRDSGFMKLREVSLSYQLPGDMAQRIGASRASVTVAGRNLQTWSDWTGLDPEARFLSGGRGGFGPLEQNHMPQLASFLTTVNISF